MALRVGAERWGQNSEQQIPNQQRKNPVQLDDAIHTVSVFYLLGPPLYGAVFTGDVLAVPVFSGSAGQTQVRVTLSDRQVTRTLLGVALGLTPASWETVLTYTHTDRVSVSQEPVICNVILYGNKVFKMSSHSELHWQNFSQKF